MYGMGLRNVMVVCYVRCAEWFIVYEMWAAKDVGMGIP